MVRISVITHTYNRANVLDRVFDSLMKQTIQDFEQLVIDDGSKDNTKDVVGEFIKQATFPIKYFYQDNNGKYFVAPSTNLELFYYHFLKNYILRELCYDCQYSRKERVSDITLADCFRAKEKHTNMLDGFGLSFLIGNSEKGCELIERIAAAGDLIAVDINDYIQPNMSEPTPKPKSYNDFWNNYENSGFYSALVTSGLKIKK